MPLCCCCCCGDKNLIFGRSIEDMLDNGMTVPVEIQKFINYLSERNGRYIYIDYYYYYCPYYWWNRK